MLGEVAKQTGSRALPELDGRSSSASPQHPIPVEVHEPEPTPFQLLKKAAGSALRPIGTAFIVLVFVVFLLVGREDLRDRILRLVGSRRLYVTTQALDDAARRVSRYLSMQLAVNATFGSLVGLGLFLIGIPHALVWAVLATLLRFIPYAGAWIAAAGPMLLAVAVAPGWSKFAWTLALYLVLELLAANVAEPLLYGSSTGISAVAILVAAVFWTWLWGPVGLLLSTPLTVCLVVIGRYVPHLEFLGILFGDEPALSSAQRFYQRMIAMDAEDAAELTDELLKDKSLADVYDTVIIPALSLAEEGRHAGFLDAAIEEYLLDNTRELVEEVGSRPSTQPALSDTIARLICLPAKDTADEIAGEMLIQLLPQTVAAELLPCGISSRDLIHRIASQKPDVVCISGVPPQTTRQVALWCKHLRKQFPDLTIVAAVWSTADLASIRSRIPVSDANHVVCTLRQAVDYIAPGVVESAEQPRLAKTEQQPPSAELKPLATPEAPLQEVLDKLTQDAAKALDAPIAILALEDERGSCWKSQCGLPADLVPDASDSGNPINSLLTPETSTRVIEDISQDDRLAKNTFLLDKGIHFYADAPVRTRSGKLVGSLRILDTRARKITDQERERLEEVALAAGEAVELRAVATPPEPSLH
ncbi:MAG: AI-2E family transporter [Acidobacteria bacterium]|nr:AI-2E family transporter [Acidobacteriota bacterium]